MRPVRKGSSNLQLAQRPAQHVLPEHGQTGPLGMRSSVFALRAGGGIQAMGGARSVLKTLTRIRLAIHHLASRVLQ